MSKKTARKRIPKSKRLLEKARRTAKAMWRDLRGKGGRKTASGKKRNPWRRCTACSRRQSPQSYVCDEHSPAGVCISCCEYPHDEHEHTEHDWVLDDDSELDEGKPEEGHSHDNH